MENILTAKVLNEKSWFEHWFDSSFYQKLYAYRNEEEARNFIDELVRELHPHVSARMLDLGCGNGRHSKYLASKGFDVTGIDLAASSIREAKKWEKFRLRFYRQDMRLPFGNNLFDYVLSFFTSFGYFEDATDDNKVINNISTALKPGGILMMDYINAVPAEKNLKATEEKEIDGITYFITRWTDEQHFFKKITIEEELFGKPLEYTERVRKFSLDDFDYMFDKNGLQMQQVFGDYKLNSYDKETSPRMILIAKKIKC